MQENTVAKILLILGWIEIVSGLFCGLIFGTVEVEYDETVFVGSVFFMWFFAGLISGIIFIGFSEVIRLLHSINQKMKMSNNRSNNLVTKNSENQEGSLIENIPVLPKVKNLSSDDQDKIYKMYSPNDISEFIPTPFEDYCIVKLVNNEIKVIDIGGFNARETQDPKIVNQINKWLENTETN